jgi:hypothetical protein
VQIDAKGIESLLVTSIICEYDIEKKSSPKHIIYEKTALHNLLYSF